MKQLLAGTRKFQINLINRKDLASMSERAYKVTTIKLLEDLDSKFFEQILG